MATYCAVTDLQKYFTAIDNYDLKMDLPDFEFVNYSGDKWKLGDSGACVVLYRSGIDLGAASASEAALSAENDWFYDSSEDVLYIQLGSGDSPEDDDIRLQRSPQDWSDAKTYACQVGTSKVDQELDARFPRPIPKVDDNPTGDDYDQAIVELCALYACLHLIEASGSEDYIDVSRRITNEEENGLLDRLNSGAIKLSFELTRSDSGEIKEITTDATTTGFLTDAIGTPSDTYEVYLATVAVGGTLSTGTENTTVTFGVTNSQGEVVQSNELMTGRYQSIGGGMSARWMPGVYVAGDQWSLTVKTTGPDTSTIGVIRMTRL